MHARFNQMVIKRKKDESQKIKQTQREKREIKQSVRRKWENTFLCTERKCNCKTANFATANKLIVRECVCAVHALLRSAAQFTVEHFKWTIFYQKIYNCARCIGNLYSLHARHIHNFIRSGHVNAVCLTFECDQSEIVRTDICTIYGWWVLWTDQN